MKNYQYSVSWNLLLIALGAVLVGIGVKIIAVPHGLLSGGMTGAGLLAYYLSNSLSPGVWVGLLSAPIFVFGWFALSRRFFLYSLVGMGLTIVVIELIPAQNPIQDPMLAALAAGALIGSGVGLAMRTLGSLGGLDIIAVALNQRYNMRVGQVSFAFNAVLFVCGMVWLDVDRMLYSLVLVFVSSQAMEYFLGMFNQRKFVLIISDHNEEIADAILKKLRRGATLLDGRGAYSGSDKKVLLTAVTNVQVKRLEEAVYTIDPKAFTIIGSALNVLGNRFSQRKVY